MANTKISQLTANTNPNGNEELVYAYNNTNGKMSLNTMKTFAGTGKQDTLVSGTNIKTINNLSLLGSGNIDIQGGGGGGAGADAYDAIVDAAGDGDYTTIGAAIDDNKRNIFVKNGTYNETQGHFITGSGVDKLIIHGETKNGVVVNCTLTAVQSDWGQFYEYPAFIFFDLRSTDNVEIKVENITFNFSVNSAETRGYLINGYWKDYCINNTKISNCDFNISNNGSDRWSFLPMGCRENAGAPDGIYEVCNCTFIGTSNTATLILSNYDTNLDCICENCYFLIKASNSNEGRMNVDNVHNSEFEYTTTNMSALRFTGKNIDNCYIHGGNNIDASIEVDVHITDMRDSKFHVRHTSSYNPTKIGVSSIVPDWATSTAYSVGDQVLYSSTFYECIEAHTSGDALENDDDKWKTIATVFIENASGCNIETGDTIQLRGKIYRNYFRINDNGDILMPGLCVFEGNNFYSTQYAHNMYINKHGIITGNVFGELYAEDISLNYVSTEENLITNNIVYLNSKIKKIGSGTGGIVDNNLPWSV